MIRSWPSGLAFCFFAATGLAQITNETPPPGYPDRGCDYDQRGNYYCWGGTGSNNNPADKWTSIALSADTRQIGISHGQDSQEAAEKLALAICRNNGASACKVAQFGRNSCLAVATSRPDNTWGTAREDTRAKAQASALASCRSYKGANCAVEYAPCATDSPTVPSPVPSVTRGPKDDPIVGCYRWFNGGGVLIRQNHVVVGGPFIGDWEAVNAEQRAYIITLPRPGVSEVTLSADQQSLKGGNQYGGQDTATRVSGTSGLAGVWNWLDVLPSKVTVKPDGTYSAVGATSTWTGTWKAVPGAPGKFRLTSSDLPKDKVTLSADSARLSGADQYGITISGTRTQSCQ